METLWDKISLFDEDGRRVYLYSFADYECSVFLASYLNVSEEDLQKEIQAAHTLWEKYMREEEILTYGKPMNDLTEDEWEERRNNDLTEEQMEMLRKKYPSELCDWDSRVCDKFQMWHLNADVSTLSVSKRCGGCMGD